MKTSLQLNRITLCAAVLLLLTFASCKKNSSLSPSGTDSESNEISNKFKTLSAGDNKYDLLGYGLDVTGDLLDPNSVSDVGIFDMDRFAGDYLYRIDFGGTGSGQPEYYGGATAMNYLHDLTVSKTIGVSGNSEYEKIELFGDKTKLFFNASVTKNTSDQTKNGFSNAYSYATYESSRVVKRLRFNGDVDIPLLMNYLTPEFLSNIANKSAEELVARYGTHVMLDITIGGRFRFDYSGQIQSQSSYSKKVEDVKMGLGFGLGKLIGLNINQDKTTTEITDATLNTSKREFKARFFGGTNSGISVAIDKDGNASQTINLSSWEQSVNATNAALIDVGKAVLLYHFIADPVKKEQVRIAVENYIQNNQINIVEDYTHELVPVNSFSAKSGGHHYLTLGLVNDFGYWNYIGQEFRAYPRQVPGSVPINVYFSQQGEDHFYTTGVINDFSWWRSEGVAFYAFTTRADGMIPVYLHTSRNGQDHYYSSSSVVYDTGYWSPSVSIAFYAYPM